MVQTMTVRLLNTETQYFVTIYTSFSTNTARSLQSRTGVTGYICQMNENCEPIR